jgi:colicin import membrane protein
VVYEAWVTSLEAGSDSTRTPTQGEREGRAAKRGATSVAPELQASKKPRVGTAEWAMEKARKDAARKLVLKAAKEQLAAEARAAAAEVAKEQLAAETRAVKAAREPLMAEAAEAAEEQLAATCARTEA